MMAVFMRMRKDNLLILQNWPIHCHIRSHNKEFLVFRGYVSAHFCNNYCGGYHG